MIISQELKYVDDSHSSQSTENKINKYINQNFQQKITDTVLEKVDTKETTPTETVAKKSETKEIITSLLSFSYVEQ